jgi:L-alanine-DL-glutamate epimerase-like enolase superfamily enzyme
MPTESPAGAAAEPARRAEVTIDRLAVSVFTIPTDGHESDGTLEWDATTLVLVEPRAGGVDGLGYSYASPEAGHLIRSTLDPVVVGRDVFETGAIWSSMVGAVRNLGRPGIAATAISAVDNALWDLKARLLGVSLADLLGRAHDAVPAYGSGGFCSYPDDRLARQLGDWARDGFRFVKMKVGRQPERDRQRVRVARDAIGDDVQLFVDANAAFQRREALAAAAAFALDDVRWFEEPVTSDDVEGLRFVRDHAPAGMAIAAGEYGWDELHFRRLLEGGAVDILQADATRCLGTTGFLMAVALAEAHHTPLSSHCAPSLHVPLLCAARPAIHAEWFHDHVRIEQALFDGAPRPQGGLLRPDRSRPGLGLELREADARPYLAWSTE